MNTPQTSQILQRQSLTLKKTLSTSSQNNPASSDPTQQITQTFTKLHDTIGNLDSKVQALLDKHEIEFLYAWQNHIKKIKNELKEIKDRSDQKQRVMNSNERVVAMEKQMALFRDQALRLYEQVEDVKAEVEICRRTIKEQELGLQILREENKELVRGVKMAEAKAVLWEQQRADMEKQLERYMQQHNERIEPSSFNSPQSSTLNNLTVDNHKLASKTFTSNQIHSKTQEFSNLNLKSSQKQKSIINPLLDNKKQPNPYKFSGNDDVLESFTMSKLKQHKLNRLSGSKKGQTNGFDVEEINSSEIVERGESQRRRGKKMSLHQVSSYPTHTHYHSFMMIEPRIYQTQLKAWFLDCIKSIKKEIFSRKTGFTSPAVDIMKIQSIDEFKTIDKLRLLEMFLENEKLLVYMYQRVFPDRLKEIQEFLVDKKGERKGRGREGKGQEEQGKWLQENRANMTISHISNGSDVKNHADHPQNAKRDHIIANENSLLNYGVSLQQQSNRKSRNESKIRVKSVSKASKSQPIRNRIIMRDGKLNLIF